MVHLIDWVAESKAVGSGVTLLKQIAREVDAVLVVGGSELTQKVLPALGARSCGTLTKFVRPLRPLQRVRGEKPGLRLIAQFARSVIWSLKSAGTPASGWAAHAITPGDPALDAVHGPSVTGDAAVFERTADSIQYLLKCPAARMEIYSVSKDGVNRGYFILAHVPGQVRIADFYVDTDDAASWRAVIQLAISQAHRNPAAAEVAAVGSDPVTRRALSECGFHVRGEAPMRLLSVTGAVLPEGPIRVQMIDSDAAYLHANKNVYWA
ncbi:MAG TPA: hypothetical protein VN519_05845 [Bryobacteraceae bacterium]|nr:hypothetical protein [Bryobacteraceae bacterium]